MSIKLLSEGELKLILEDGKFFNEPTLESIRSLLM